MCKLQEPTREVRIGEQCTSALNPKLSALNPDSVQWGEPQPSQCCCPTFVKTHQLHYAKPCSCVGKLPAEQTLPLPFPRSATSRQQHAAHCCVLLPDKRQHFLGVNRLPGPEATYSWGPQSPATTLQGPGMWEGWHTPPAALCGSTPGGPACLVPAGQRVFFH